MNPRDGTDHVDQASGDEALRWQLRTLRHDQPPLGDLWPGIAARLQPRSSVSVRQAQPQQSPPEDRATPVLLPVAVAATRRPQGRSRYLRWAPSFALAATMVLVLGVAGWWQTLQSRIPDTQSLVQREAAGMTRQYRAALAEIDVATGTSSPMALQPTFDDLDRNARLILDALDRDPDSRLLLQQLRRTYAHHLALAQRAVLS